MGFLRIVFIAWIALQAGLANAKHQNDLVFIPNRGQWKEPFDYKASSEGVSLFISSSKATVVMTPPVGHPRPTRPAPGTPTAFAFEVVFKGAREGTEPVQAASIPTPIHFISSAGSYSTQPASRFKYKDVLGEKSSIQWRNTGGQASFDLTVPPQADLSKYGFSVRGAALSITGKGDLAISTPYGPVTITAPKAYNLKPKGDRCGGSWGKSKVPVECRFKIRGKGKVGFTVGKEYDEDYPLLIDPTLIFATYSGSRADNWGNTATYGPGGTMFSGGIAFDRGFPATLGALDTSYHGSVDIGILKYSADGKRLLWATYLGGDATETGHSLIADALGRLYILGTTSSANFPTTPGAFDRSFNGGPSADPMGYSFVDYWYPNGSDFVIACLDTNGARLVASTFLGGTGTDGILPLPDAANLTRNYGDQFKGEIVLDAQGRVCLAGTTTSSNFPVRNGLGRGYAGAGDAVVARLTPDLDTLQSASYFGGSGRETAYGIALDSAGNTYITGGTQSPALAGTAGSTYRGQSDGYLLALNPAWTSIQRTRYLGTTNYDQSFLVQADRAGNVYATGQTGGAWPVTAGTYSNPTGGQFLVSFTPGLAAERFSTRFGGNSNAPDLVLTALLVDECGKIYLSGWGGTTNDAAEGYIGGSTTGLPVSPDAHQSATDGSDFYLLVLERDASSLHYATFMGGTSPIGEHVDGGTSRFDKRGVVYQAVCGCGGSSFPTTPGVWSPANPSQNCNNAGFKFDFSQLRARFIVDRMSGCIPYTVNLRNVSEFGTSYRWTFGSDTSSRADSIFTYTFNEAGSFPVTLRAINPQVCQIVDSTTIVLTAHEALALPDTTLRFCTTGDTIQLNNLVLPGYRYLWPGLPDSSQAQPRIVPTESQAFSCQITSPQGCQASRTVRVPDHRHTGQLLIGITIPACTPYPMQPSLSGLGANDSITWDYGDGFVFQGLSPPTHFYGSAGSYTLRVTAYGPDSLCMPTLHDTALIVVNGAQAYADSSYRFCSTTDSVRMPNLHVPGYTYRWVPNTGLSSDTAASPFFQASQSGTRAYTAFITTPDGCEARRNVTMNDGILEVDFQTRFGPNLCLRAQTPMPVAVDSRFLWSDVTWTVNGHPLPDSSGGQNDPYSHYLPGLRMDTAGRYDIRIQVRSGLACQSEAGNTLSIAVGKTTIPRDTTLKLCPEDDYRLVVPSAGAIASTRWLPVGGQLPEFNGRFTHEATLTAAMVDTFGCSLSRNYRLEQQALSAQTEVRPEYDTCQNKYRIYLNANPFPPADGASWVWQDMILGRNTVLEVPGSVLDDTTWLKVSLRGCYEQVPFILRERNEPVEVSAAFTVEAHYRDCGEYPTLHLQADASCKDCYHKWTIVDRDGPSDGGDTYYRPTGNSVPITLSVKNGPCEAESTQTFEVRRLVVPNVVTPNSDGMNEFFRIPQDAQPLQVRIFNRLGKPVYNGYGEDWPKPDTPTGTYFYTISGISGKDHTCTGWVEVVR